MKSDERVYLDWAAASPLLPEAKAAMLPHLENEFANPSAIHAEGVLARKAVEQAREKIARAMQVKPEYITFTGGGTEGNNLVIFGTIEAARQADRDTSDMEVVTTRIEHPSVYRAMHRLEQMGVGVKYVDVDECGLIERESLKTALNEKTVLISFAYANSEIGSVQNLHAIRKLLKEVEEQHGTQIMLHVDAAQAPLWLSCQFDTVGADFLVLDFAKCQGPKGTGAVVRSKRAEVVPTVFGGGQESGMRPGTENVAGIVGAAIAFEVAQASWRKRAERVAEVRDMSISTIQGQIPTAILNGPGGENRIANNINISLPGIDTEFATIVLDTNGFAVSTKSACAGAGGGESAVVQEISSDSIRAQSTLRITLGPETTTEELQNLTQVLKTHIEKSLT